MIKFIIIILVIYLLYLNSIKIKNYLIRKQIKKFYVYITFKEKLDKKALTNYLNTFEIFDYNICYELLLYKTNKKSYLILDNNENLSKEDIENHILIIIFQDDPKTIELIIDHGLFDGHLLMNMFNDYYKTISSLQQNKNYKMEEINYTSIINLPKKYSTMKKKYITEIVNIADFQPFFLNKYNHEKKLYTIPKITILNKQQEFKKYNKYISKMDIIFSIVCKNFMKMFNKKVFNALIVKSHRSNNYSFFNFSQSEQIIDHTFTNGNMIYSHIIQVKDDNLFEMSDSIRNSYNKHNFSFKFIDIKLISWCIPNKNIISMKTKHDYNKISKSDNLIVFISYDKDNYLIMT